MGTVNTPRPETSPPQPKVYTVERPRFPLVWKLFGLTALLIASVVAIAVAITIQRANTVASASVNKSISGAAKLFKELEKQRLGRLALSARLVGGDSGFYAYIQSNLNPAPANAAAAPGAVPGQPAVPAPASTPGPDLVSILDQLTQRRESFGSDLVMLLDDQGRVLAR